MSGRVRRKWRPPLALVIGGTLAAVLALPIIGLTWLRLAGNILGWLETAQLIGVISLVATIVLALLLWRLVLRPVWALTAHARAMKSGDTDHPPPVRFGTHELGQLGHSVIEMGDALYARARSLSAYADHVTHELRSPLTSLQGAVEMLKDPKLPAEDRAVLMQTIDTSSARMEQLLVDLRTHAKARWDAAPGQCVLSAVIADLDVPDGLALQMGRDGTIPMSGPDLLRVLTLMMGNSAAYGARELTLSAGEEGLDVRDDGPGIPEGDRARIFDPFFTTHRDSGGTGMGLSICRTLVEAAGGRIDLAPSPQGAVFQIRF